MKTSSRISAQPQDSCYACHRLPLRVTSGNMLNCSRSAGYTPRSVRIKVKTSTSCYACRAQLQTIGCRCAGIPRYANRRGGISGIATAENKDEGVILRQSRCFLFCSNYIFRYSYLVSALPQSRVHILEFQCTAPSWYCELK